tara:strand:- start:518 stop:973 length:456 start_codon:yes stop_codon:yes gene_type:complete
MDSYDKKILFILQRNADLPLSEISRRVGLSPTPCWNRIKKLEEEGVILKKVTILNKEKLSLPVTVFLNITVRTHNEDWGKKFNEILKRYNNILEAYRVTGSEADYVLKIVSESIEEYDKFQQVLIKNIQFNSMSSAIVLQELKLNYNLPIR